MSELERGLGGALGVDGGWLPLPIGPSVGPSVCQHESKSDKTSVLEVFCVCVGVGIRVGWGVRCGWGLAASAHPSATIL